MKKLSTIIIVALVLLGGFTIWVLSKPDAAQETVTFTLDWTPNTNHTGIYAAQQKGWYKDAGINLKLLPYSASVSSDSLVATGKADAGIGFTEGVVANAASDNPVVSIATIIANNTSVIAVLKDSGITSPKQLENKTYGGYGAPYESAVISQIIKHAGGKDQFTNITVDTAPLDALRTKRVDFVWVYSGWEGVQAKREGLELTTFPITKHGIPDYGTPNIITAPATFKNKHDLLKRFMSVTAKGYEFARTNPKESAQLLIDGAPAGTFPDKQLVFDSQKYLSPLYQPADKPWGVQQRDFWSKYPQFMLDKRAVLDSQGRPVTKLDFDSLYTNELLEP